MKLSTRKGQFISMPLRRAIILETVSELSVSNETQTIAIDDLAEFATI
jgi:hypothetical protein